MRRDLLVVAAACWLSVGCQTPTPTTYPPDPLLIVNKPVARMPRATTSLLAAEPTPPARPTDFALTQIHREIDSPPLHSLAHYTTEPVAEPVFDAASDLRWLEGVLEKTSDGHFELCYRRPTLDAPAGKVRLADDPCLSRLGDGDAIRVEGVLIPSIVPPEGDAPQRYKVSAIANPGSFAGAGKKSSVQ